MVRLEKYIVFSLILNYIIFNTLAGCGNVNNEKKGKGCCGYGQRKDNNDITGDDDDKENDDDKKKKEEENKKKEEEDKKKEEENFYKNNYSYFQKRYDDLNFLLDCSIERNEFLNNKEEIDITKDEIYKQKTKDGLDNIEDYLKKLKNKIEEKIKIEKKQEQEEFEKKSTEVKRNNVLFLFDSVNNYKKKLGLSDEKISLGITRKQIEDEKNENKLTEIHNNLIVKREELTNFELKMIDIRFSNCKNDDDFIEKFNYIKNILADRFNDELKNEIKSNILTKENISDYYSMYQEMINDVFTHKIALDLQIYRYILKLEGFTEALDNIIEKNRIKYDFFTEYSNNNAGYTTTIFKKDDNYYLKYNSKVNINEYDKFRDIYSGIFYIDNVPFKYVRCEKDKCDYDEKEEYCISCKLRNLLEKENIGDLYKKIYKEYGGSSDAGDTVRAFIYNNIKPEYQDRELFFIKNDKIGYDGAVVWKGNEDSFKKYNYENGEEKYKNIKKALMLEWALTIEFMKRFIQKFTGENEFYLYRTMGFLNDTTYNPTNKLLSQAVDSTSLFGPCYFGMSNTNIICFHKIKAKLYCCFFNHIINPFPIKEHYSSNIENEFLNGKLLGDYECEIGYIPVNQKYEEEVKCDRTKPGEIWKIQNYVYERTIENFKQNMLNDPTTKTSKLHVFKDDKIINLN